MLKKVFSLLLAAMIFLPATVAVAADIKAFSGIPDNQIAKNVNVIQNDAHFVKDYSKIFADVYKDFVNNITALAVLPDSSIPFASIQKILKKLQITEGLFANNFIEKGSFLCGSFIDAALNQHSKNHAASFLLFVLMFILWYIGLLRLFSGASFSMHIKL